MRPPGALRTLAQSRAGVRGSTYRTNPHIGSVIRVTLGCDRDLRGEPEFSLPGLAGAFAKCLFYVGSKGKTAMVMALTAGSEPHSKK